MSAGIGVLYVVAEVTEGTYVDALTGQALLVESFDWGFGGEPSKDRSSLIGAYPGAMAPTFGSLFHEVSIGVPAYHWGATDSATAHPHAVLFAAGPHTVTVGASDDDDLTIRPALATDAGTSFSMAFAHENGNLYKFRGCKAILEEIAGPGPGDPVTMKFKIQGLQEATPAAHSINFSAVSYGSYIPITASGATIDLGVSGVQGLASWVTTTGEKFMSRSDQSETYGFKTPHVGYEGYTMTSVNTEEVVDGTYAIWAAGLASTVADVALTFPGPGTDTFAVVMQAATPMLPKLGERDGLSVYETEFKGSWLTTGHFGLVFS